MSRGSACSAVVLVCLLSLFASSSALASGLDAPSVGPGNANPVQVSPAAIYWNPGQLGFLERAELLLGGHMILGSVNYTRERRADYQQTDSFAFALPISADAIDPTLTGPAEAVSAVPFGLAPTLFAGIPVGDSGVVAGLGVYVPFAALISYPEDGAQRWQLQEATIISIFVTPSVAYRPTEWLSIGVGASYVIGFAELQRIQDFAGLPDLGQALANPPINQANDFGPDAPPGVRELDVLARPIQVRDAFGGGFSFNAGVALRPSDWLSVGLAYQHGVDMDFVGDFSLDMSDDFFTRDLASQGMAYDPLIEGEASLGIPLPGSVRAGVGVEISETIGFDVVFDYTFYSVIEAFDVRVQSEGLAQPEVGLPDTTSLSIRRDWEDVIALGLTGRLQYSEHLSGWLTGGYSSSAAPDSTIDAASPDGDWLIINMGMQWWFSDDLALLGEVQVQSILPREVVGSRFDLANGEYNMTLVDLGVHFRYGW